MSSPPQEPSQEPSQEPTTQQSKSKSTLTILTYHCRFCNHLLLATTQKLSTLPRRKEPAKDSALILPLLLSPSPSLDTTQGNDGKGSTENTTETHQKHYTILLSTALPERKATLVRREDGFEKRRFVRCGRCRVAVGYFLDAVHFPVQKGRINEEDGEDGESAEDRAKVVYLLPGALVDTESMGDSVKTLAMDREWTGWIP
ncbi:hypothetical protein EYZ11_005987 [Aspergillus tanneri]|uniref:STEEP1 domain-containing protein n=1 Tax=Aspergillus tanneri TaxID=1220188 RepID=A0A4S3JGL4_9EURO|nr:uncharacterized protein ATNIH1004_005568 [Aspergillus tanneri]KAA8646893.1 hypothetical protein ATNIH1004_005568 [Aspergillus tanneri]THC94546.1 hypothetical protein EYZ11_005987 [Aspergillus tanneri]